MSKYINTFKFEVLWENEKTADVDVGVSTVRVKRHVLHPVKQIFYADEITRYELGNILRSRCYDRRRPDIDKILEFMGLQEYDVYKMCRFTHGKMAQDFIWFRYEGEDLRWEDLEPCGRPKRRE